MPASAGMGGGEAYVCYGISRSCLKGGMNAGGMPVCENTQPAITANGAGAVCYGALNPDRDDVWTDK